MITYLIIINGVLSFYLALKLVFLFLFEKIIVTIILGLVIGAIFYDLKNDPTGIQNR